MGLFETTEEEIYEAAISQPLEEKIAAAIALIQEYEPMALQLSADGYAVGFSGGKDSQAVHELFVMAGVKFEPYYNNVTIDPPELVQFIKKNYPHVRWNNPEKHLLHKVIEKAPGLPTRRGRWCCEIYKEQGGRGSFKSFGIRASESPRRKGLWRTVRLDGGTPTLSPILFWTSKNVWDFIHKRAIPYCTLYDEGFERLGCVGCPLNPAGRLREFKRWPKYKKMWREAGRAWWEKYRVRKKPDGGSYFAAKFETFEDYWAWWMEDKNIQDTERPDCQLYLW